MTDRTSVVAARRTPIRPAFKGAFVDLHPSKLLRIRRRLRARGHTRSPPAAIDEFLLVAALRRVSRARAEDRVMAVELGPRQPPWFSEAEIIPVSLPCGVDIRHRAVLIDLTLALKCSEAADS